MAEENFNIKRFLKLLVAYVVVAILMVAVHHFFNISFKEIKLLILFFIVALFFVVLFLSLKAGAFKSIENSNTTQSTNSNYPILSFSLKSLIASAVIFYSLYFFGISNLSKQMAFYFGVLSLGLLSIWAGFYYHHTKQSIQRGGHHGIKKSYIEFNNNPSEHKSSVFALLILGLIFFFMGLGGILNA